MDPDLRSRFNALWSEELASNVRADLERRIGCAIPFPVAETPLFFPTELRKRFSRTAREIVALLGDPAWIETQQAAVPAAYDSPGRGELPQLTQVDFAVVREEDGTLAPRLVELQGFPSLYGFQIQLADVWATHLASLPGLPDHWHLFFGGLDRYQAMALVRKTLLKDSDPEEVVLLDIDPEHQKTKPDFEVTRRWWGIDAVCITDLKRDGERLFRVKDGKTIPVRRIYHRIVMDELEQRNAQVVFNFHEPLDVQWVPHPAWFFLWSKNSLLHLDHPAVPWTRLLSEIDELPGDLENYVLKPLYSFAGLGVNIDPTPEDVAAVPEAERKSWVLQEKIEYAPAVQSAEGFGVKVELRMMFVRPDDSDELQLLMNLVRLSRGKMMGVDWNRDLSWTGSSVGIWAD